MKKQRLDLDTIEVESFVTASAQTSGAGTVFGHAKSYPADTCDAVCQSANDACSGDSGCPGVYCPPESFYCDSFGGGCGPVGGV